MNQWSKYGDIHFNYKGKTKSPKSDLNDNKIVLGFWGENHFIQKFGKHAGRTRIKSRNGTIVDGYVILNAGNNRKNSVGSAKTLQELRGLILHEIGHLIGINHSDKSASIMFANPYHPLVYQSRLRQDDKNAIRRLYPKRIRYYLAHEKNYGALAYSSENGAIGISSLENNIEDAKKVALEDCALKGCKILTTATNEECLSLAITQESADYGYSKNQNLNKANKEALKQCKSNSDLECNNYISFCVK